MSEQIFNKIHDLLSKNGAKFRVIEHESARTSDEVAKIRGTKMSQGAKALVCSIKGVDEAKFREILKYFTEDIEASKISNLTKISEATLCKIFREIRILMSKECEKVSKFSGEISSSQARLEASL